MTGYTKLFSSIIHSTVWRAPDHVRLVWVTMLAMANKHGEVEASMPGLADAARVSLAECTSALEILTAPDIHSRSKEHEGRRIRPIDGGWVLLNHGKYRAKMSAADLAEKNRARQAKWRAKRKGDSRPGNAAGNAPGVTVTECNANNDKQKQKAEAKADSKADAEAPPADLGTDPRATAIATAIRSHVPAITDPDEAAERLLGVAPLHALDWWLAGSVKDAAAELETGCNYDTAIRKLRVFVKNTSRAPKVHDDAPLSEAEHETSKRRISAEYRADQARIAREQGEAAPVDLIRKLTAGIGRPVGTQ